MRSSTVTVTDGVLDIDFVRVISNPNIKAFEIVVDCSAPGGG